jgi:hypothetical protein
VLVAAALVPPTALLVPGAAGRGDVLAVERSAALAAVGTVVAAEPDVIVVVPPGPGPVLVGRLLPSLAAAGLDDDGLGWTPRPTSGAGRAVRITDVATSVALLLLDRAGWTGAVEVSPASPTDGATQRMRGDALVAGARRVGLVLVGGLSARHGPDGPLATDERAAAVDGGVLADLTDLGPAARARLAAVPAHLARVLAISAWGPWQVLVGAAPGDATVVTRHASAPLGAAYATVSWRWP